MTPQNVGEVKNNFRQSAGGSVIKKLGNTSLGDPAVGPYLLHIP